jgi:hypothetical protein
MAMGIGKDGRLVGRAADGGEAGSIGQVKFIGLYIL